MHVLDGKNTVVFSSVDGERVDADPLQRYETGLARLLADARNVEPATAPIPATGFLRKGGTYYLVSAIRMTTYFEVDDKEIDLGTDHVMVFAEALDAEFLPATADGYMLPNLAIIGQPQGLWIARHGFETYGGGEQAFFAWDPDLPGSVLLPKLMLGLGAVFILMLLVARNFVRRAADVAQSLEDARRQAERANRAKSEFVRTVTHEVRTPVNAILGFAQVLQREMFGPLGSPKYAEYADDIVQAGDYMLDLVGDLLDLERIESGKASLSPEVMDANEALASAVSYVEPMATDKGLVLALQPMEGVAEIRSDPRALHQILLNLLSNAVKFTPPGGEVACRTFAKGSDAIAIQVADTGPGLSAAQIEKVLQPFGQIDSAQVDLGKGGKKRGSGLGLPIARRLTEALGGVFDFASILGRGTTVTLILPVDR